MHTDTLATPATTTDTFPINGTDYIEFWVGNAKQASLYYRAAFGFQLVGYRGPETGVRDRASYLLQQDKIRFVLTTPIRPDLSEEAKAVADHIYRHGDGVRDLALWVDDAREALRQAIERGARLGAGAAGLAGRRRRDGDRGDPHLRRHHPLAGRAAELPRAVPPRLPAVSPPYQPAPVGLKYVDHCVGNVELGR